MGNLLGMVWESIGDLKGIIGSLYAMVSSFSRGPKTCKSKAKVPLRAAFRDGVPCGGSRDVWIEKLLEPYACNAEFVVHVASLWLLSFAGNKCPKWDTLPAADFKHLQTLDVFYNYSFWGSQLITVLCFICQALELPELNLRYHSCHHRSRKNNRTFFAKNLSKQVDDWVVC